MKFYQKCNAYASKNWSKYKFRLRYDCFFFDGVIINQVILIIVYKATSYKNRITTAKGIPQSP